MAFDQATALLFPGQGSQQPQMRDAVAEAAPELLERCLDLIGDDPFERVDESTRFAQPAIYLASVAGWRRAGQPPTDYAAMAGHSLGEIAALVAADALDARDGLELVVERGRLMAAAGEADDGGRVLALPGAGARAARQLAQAHGVVVANENAPGQIVLSGPRAAIKAVGRD